MDEYEGLRAMNHMANLLGMAPLLTEPTELGHSILIDLHRLSGEPTGAMREFCLKVSLVLRDMEKFVSDPSNKITKINWDTFRIVTQPDYNSAAYKITTSMRALREI